MKALSRLLFKYMFAGEAFFFIFVFPIMILGIMGEVFMGSVPNEDRHAFAKSFINGIAITSVLSAGIFLLPITIIDFKTSVLMKRIGATNIKPYQFLAVVLGLFILQSSISYTYTRLVGTFIFGWRDHISWDVGFHSGFLKSLPWLVVISCVTVLLGLVIASLAKNVRQVTTIANIIYFPISILSGGFSPIENVQDSTLLSSINWINPFKYALEPYYQANGSALGLSNIEQYLIYPIITLVICIGFSAIIMKKLKWST